MFERPVFVEPIDVGSMSDAASTLSADTRASESLELDHVVQDGGGGSTGFTAQEQQEEQQRQMTSSATERRREVSREPQQQMKSSDASHSTAEQHKTRPDVASTRPQSATRPTKDAANKAVKPRHVTKQTDFDDVTRLRSLTEEESSGVPTSRDDVTTSAAPAAATGASVYC